MIIWIAGVAGLAAAILFLWRSRTGGKDEAGEPSGPEPPVQSDPGDRRPFGEGLARRMWRHVMESGDGYGISPYGHRDYCGHGLARVGSAVVLCTVYDGTPVTKEPIASWDEEEEFVAFFARQSNRTVNGYDRAEPVFFTDDEWALANQRLNREAVEAVLARPPYRG